MAPPTTTTTIITSTITTTTTTTTTMITTETTTVQLTNLSGATATLDSVAYGSAPVKIRNGTKPISFHQNTSIIMPGYVIYDIENKVRWVFLWTNDNTVATQIVAAGAPVTLTDIWNTAQSSEADSSFTTDCGAVYTASAYIHSGSNGVQNLSVTISQPTTITTTVQLTNTSGSTATMVSTAYGYAPERINSGATPTSFQQNTSNNMPGSVIYDIGNKVRLVFLWSVYNSVAIQIVAAGTPITLIDIWNTAQSSHSENSFTTKSGETYKAIADISPSSDGVNQNLIIRISNPITTTKATTVLITNTSGATARLDSATYESAPKTISNGTTPISFQQTTSTIMPGSVIYDIENRVRWAFLWTDENRVATQIVAVGTSTTLIDIWKAAQSSQSNASFATDSGEVYNASADIKLVNGVQTLTATISNGAN